MKNYLQSRIFSWERDAKKLSGRIPHPSAASRSRQLEDRASVFNDLRNELQMMDFYFQLVVSAQDIYQALIGVRL